MLEGTNSHYIATHGTYHTIQVKILNEPMRFNKVQYTRTILLNIPGDF